MPVELHVVFCMYGINFFEMSSHSHSKLLRKKEVLVFCFGRNGSCQPRRNGKTGLGPGQLLKAMSKYLRMKLAVL